MKQLIIFITIFSSFLPGISAQALEMTPQKGGLKLETNLGFWSVGGPNINGFYIAPKHLALGFQYVGTLELPDFSRDQFFDRAEELTINWDFAIGIEARYRFTPDALNKGFYVLSGLGYEGWSVQLTEDGNGAVDQFSNWYWSVGLGYNWFPFKNKQFHLGGSYNLIFLLNNTDDRRIGDRIYNLNNIVPPSFLPSAIYAAWRFNL